MEAFQRTWASDIIKQQSQECIRKIDINHMAFKYSFQIKNQSFLLFYNQSHNLNLNHIIKMFPGMFWVKYFFRICHIGSLVILCQAIINAKMTGEVATTYKWLYATAGILVVISGLVNTYILKPKEMGEKRKLWVAYNHIKALTAILLFTPIVKALPISVESRIDIQFYWMITALLFSPFARFYREFFVAKYKEKREKEVRQDSNDE